MSLRDWLNSILQFIGTTTLTDSEYAAMNVLNVTINVYDQFSYDQLANCLKTRSSVSTFTDKLSSLYTLKGATFTPTVTGKSNVYLGDVL